MSKLPNGWTLIPLAEAMKPDAPIIYGILQPGPNVSDGIPYVRPTEIVDGSINILFLRKTTEDISNRYRRSSLEEGDVILSIVGTIGKVAKIPAQLAGGNITQSSCRLRADNGIISNDFLSSYLLSPIAIKQFEEKKLGTGVPRLNLQDIREFLIPVPPPREQQRIVTQIDRLFARSRQARGELTSVCTLIDRCRDAVLASEFDGDRRTTGRPHTRRTSVGRYLAEKIRNGLSVAGSDIPPGIPALKLSALRSDVVDLADVRYLEIDPDRAYKYFLAPSDILVSRGNGALRLVGKGAIVPDGCEDVIFPDTAFRLRPDPSLVDARWLLWMWNAPQMRSQIESAARTTAGIWKISQADIASFELPDVPISEQREIVRRIKCAFAAIERLAAEACSARDALDKLNEAILARAFHGELVPQDPDDEPASVLLDRVRAARAAAGPTPKRERRPRGPAA